MRAMDYVDKRKAMDKSKDSFTSILRLIHSLFFLASLINKIHRPCYYIFNNNKKNYRFKSDSHVNQ